MRSGAVQHPTPSCWSRFLSRASLHSDLLWTAAKVSVLSAAAFSTRWIPYSSAASPVLGAAAYLAAEVAIRTEKSPLRLLFGSTLSALVASSANLPGVSSIDHPFFACLGVMTGLFFTWEKRAEEEPQESPQEVYQWPLMYDSSVR